MDGLRSGRSERTRVGGKARFSAERRIQSRTGLMNPFDGTQQGLLDEHLSRPIYRNRSVSASPTGQIPGCSASGVARFAGQKKQVAGQEISNDRWLELSSSPERGKQA
jgi:hypothetical protein